MTTTSRVLLDTSVLIDISSVRLCGTLASLVRRNGRNPRPRRLDLQIAATAGAHGLPLLTRNPADFADVVHLVEVVEI